MIRLMRHRRFYRAARTLLASIAKTLLCRLESRNPNQIHLLPAVPWASALCVCWDGEAPQAKPACAPWVITPGDSVAEPFRPATNAGGPVPSYPNTATPTHHPNLVTEANVQVVRSGSACLWLQSFG